MSAYNTLEHILREVLEVLKTLQEDWETRSQFINELRGVVESVESLRGNLCFHSFMVCQKIINIVYGDKILLKTQLMVFANF